MKAFREYLEEGLISKTWNFFKIGLILMLAMNFHGFQYNRLAKQYAEQIRPECEFSQEINDMSPRMTEEFLKIFKKKIGLMTNLKSDFNFNKEKFIDNNKKRLAVAADDAYVEARLKVKNQERKIEEKDRKAEVKSLKKQLKDAKKGKSLNDILNKQ